MSGQSEFRQYFADMDSDSASRSTSHISYSTSSSEEHPPRNILNRDPCKYWITSGTFPAIFTVSYRDKRRVSSVQLYTSQVKAIQVFAGTEESFLKGYSTTPVCQQDDIPDEDDQMQTISLKNKGTRSTTHPCIP
ncbi:intraflagellar transport protein 25 homolog isoform X2 [Sycon ciliatum]|uniref:intraflagellar transport protein 25 homolog isoform X2 n=1 Tax=Sycon ciliatum TaxID=27933 RepID=UPI0031F6113A